MFYNWGKRTKEIYPDNSNITLDDIKSSMNICFKNKGTSEDCNACKFHNSGCSDRIAVVLQERIQQLPDFETNKDAQRTNTNFDICFSDGTPERCKHCTFRGYGCWKKLFDHAYELLTKTK